MRRALRKEPLLLAMLLAVVVGVAGGSLARALHPSGREIELLGILLLFQSACPCTSYIAAIRRIQRLRIFCPDSLTC